MVIDMEDELKVNLETTQFIVIKIGDEQYGININNIDNILRMQHITRVPKVANYIKGVINLRGEVIPVISLRMRMGLNDDEETKNTRIIILKIEQQEVMGVIVDEVREVVTLSEEQMERVSYENRDDKKNYIYGIGKYDGGLISLLDLNTIVLEN